MAKSQTKSDPLQHKNQTISDFIRRTDALAERVGLNLSDSMELMGISKPMLFAYRAGTNRITPKVWLKLERAECDAGSGANPDFAESNAKANETGIGETTDPPPPGRGLEERVERMEALMERMALALERLADQSKNQLRLTMKESDRLSLVAEEHATECVVCPAPPGERRDVTYPKKK